MLTSPKGNQWPSPKNGWACKRVYKIVTDEQTEQQIKALPANALTAFAEARVVLELVPWSGKPYHARKPDGPMRTLTFGPDRQGSVIYLILEDQRRVDPLDILWLDTP